MEPPEGVTNHILDAFNKMESLEDLLNLLNYCKKTIYGPRAIPFTIQHLRYHSHPRANEHRYLAFTIPKKNGGQRVINAPAKGLKVIQKCLNLVLQTVYEPHLHKAATGFAPNRSILDNAKIHANANYVYNIDLKDFFPSIDQARIWGRLKHPPFNLNELTKRQGINNIIASLCCHGIEVERLDEENNWVKTKRNVLPQGAPTSPMLSNIVCQRLDFYLTAVAKRFGLQYSRYADDLTFSSPHNVYHPKGVFITEMRRIISNERFTVNESKTRLQKRGYRQEVTGLIVNDRVNVKQDYIKDLRKWLYYGEVYGMDRANTLYFQDRSKEAVDTQQIKELGKVLSGKLSHLRMVVGAKNKAYLKLKERLQGLISPPKTITQEAIKTVAAVEQSSSLNTLLVAETQEVYLSRPTSKGPVTSPRRPLPHNPFYTAKFLNQFAVADRSGFKELVHDIELNDQIIEEILEKVKSHPNFRYHYKNQRVAIKFVNKAIQREIIKVIDLFESTGVPYFKKTGKHPFNHEPQYTELAKKLKAMYRFGTGGEATSLQRDILETAAACKVSKEFISFLPDARAFNIRTGAIYTWAPAIAKGLKYIFQGIADHSNVEGNKSRETTIVITAEHFPDDDKYRRNVQLTILNKYSQPTVNSSDLLSKLRGSEPFQNYFRSLCDWIVESDFYEESSKRLNVLVPDKLPDKQKYKDVEGLDTKAGGFKHKLIFYRGR